MSDVLTCPGCGAEFPRLHPVMFSVEGYALGGKRYCTTACAATMLSVEVGRLRGYLRELATSRLQSPWRELVELALHTHHTVRDYRMQRLLARKETHS